MKKRKVCNETMPGYVEACKRRRILQITPLKGLKKHAEIAFTDAFSPVLGVLGAHI
ncbi:MAG: hypothetical protein IJK42_14345 [Prevotella sp.]|nr:hypothetical protein [Prevotella sp.]